jgi:hypothetical protein
MPLLFQRGAVEGAGFGVFRQPVAERTCCCSDIISGSRKLRRWTEAPRHSKHAPTLRGAYSGNSAIDVALEAHLAHLARSEACSWNKVNCLTRPLSSV